MLILFYDLAQCDKWTLTDSLESPKCLSYKESLDAISEESWVTLSDEKAYWADQGFFYSFLSHRNLQYKFEWKALHIKGSTPFISSLLYCKKPAGYNQFQFSWLNIVHQSTWCIHEKAYWGISSFFALFFHTEICSTNLNDKNQVVKSWCECFLCPSCSQKIFES